MKNFQFIGSDKKQLYIGGISEKISFLRDVNGTVFFDSYDSNDSITRVSFSNTGITYQYYDSITKEWTIVWSK